MKNNSAKNFSTETNLRATQVIFWIRVLLRTTVVLSCVMALASFIYLFALHGASASFDPDSGDQRAAPVQYPCSVFGCPRPRIEYIYPGTFDRESWLCQFSSFARFTTSPWVDYNATSPERSNHVPNLSIYKKICVLERGARVTSIFPVLFSMVLCFLFYADWKGDKILIRTWKRRAQEPDSSSEWEMEDLHE